MSYFKNKNVLVTGGASGIGYLMGQKALKRGARHLVIFDIDKSNLVTAEIVLKHAGFSVSTYVVDVSDAGEIKKTAEKVLKELSCIDILINNAGIIAGKSFRDHSIEDIDKTFGVNTLGLMYVTKAFLPAMEEKGEGHIVNIASAAGLTPNPGMSVYAGSKWAAVGWSESLRLELKRERKTKRIKVLTVMPSYIDTGMFAGINPPLFMPLLDAEYISSKILDATEKKKARLREPFIVKLTPFIRGILPGFVYDFVAGKLFKVYDSMETFVGRKKDKK